MNIETIELKAVEQTLETDTCADVLALSFDDLDLVGGGSSALGLGF
jgi:hypothetical protein